MHAGERVRGFLAAKDLSQKAVAVNMRLDPGTLSRRLDNPDAWEMFLLGWEARAIAEVECNGFNDPNPSGRAQRMQRG